MLRTGPLEYLIMIVIVLMWFVPFIVAAILVRNYLWTRRTKESQELQAEIELLKQQVAALEGKKE